MYGKAYDQDEYTSEAENDEAETHPYKFDESSPVDSSVRMTAL